MSSNTVYVNEKHVEGTGRQPSTYDHARRPQRRTILPRFVLAALLFLTLLFLSRSIFIGRGTVLKNNELLRKPLSDERQDLPRTGKVALEAHIMSKCPDAKDCLQNLVVPTMAQVSEKVNFTLSYIGQVDDYDDSVSCKHGPAECLGNMIELCVARIYPDPKIYLGFTNCMTLNYSQIPDKDLVQYCSLEHGVDFERVNDCLSDEGIGTELLRKSILRSQEYNVTKSCTVRLAGEIRCIRDGGKWYDCPGGSEVADLVRDVEKLYKADTATMT